jgi:hypothetical protein
MPKIKHRKTVLSAYRSHENYVDVIVLPDFLVLNQQYPIVELVCDVGIGVAKESLPEVPNNWQDRGSGRYMRVNRNNIIYV